MLMRLVAMSLVLALLLSCGLLGFQYGNKETEKFLQERNEMLDALVALADARHAASQSRGEATSVLVAIAQEYFDAEQWERVFEYIRILDDYAPWQCPENGKAPSPHSICYELK